MKVLKSVKKVVCGVSGGVDSSVAAYLLKQKGYEVVGLFMKNWDEKNEQGECFSDKEREDAQYVCNHLRIPMHDVNFVKEYWNDVFSPFLDDYQKSRVPNPDVLCNRYIKFGALLKHAEENMGADAIATGHYAKTSFGENFNEINPKEGVKLLKTKDVIKDQTFFLSQISQKALQKTIFPLGDLLKPDVKRIACEIGLEKIARKKESMGICFIGKRKFPSFIAEYVEPKTGNYINVETGDVIGTHQGTHNYTIGQKVGHAGYGLLGKCYAVSMDHVTQDIIVAPGTNHPSLFSMEFYIEQPYWIHKPPSGLTENKSCDVEFKFQHVEHLQKCTIQQTDSDSLKVSLALPKRALTPGQFAVFYSGEECLGSAVISKIGPSLYHLSKERTFNISLKS